MASGHALNPPPENERTIQFFTTVNKALNDIDRSRYPPIATLPQRHGQIIAEYALIEASFRDEAISLGIQSWLRFAIVSRTFLLTIASDSLESVGRLYEELEALGHPSIHNLIGTRINWASRLSDEGHFQEAQNIARRLLNDIDELEQRRLIILASDTKVDLDRFRERMRV